MSQVSFNRRITDMRFATAVIRYELNALCVSTAYRESQRPLGAVQKARRCASISQEMARFQGRQLNKRETFVTERLAPHSKRSSNRDRVGTDCSISTNLCRGPRTSIENREPRVSCRANRTAQVDDALQLNGGLGHRGAPERQGHEPSAWFAHAGSPAGLSTEPLSKP
jgi:hypothetical protein